MDRVYKTSERLRKNSLAYYQRNRAKVLARTRKYRKLHAAEINKRKRQARRDNIDAYIIKERLKQRRTREHNIKLLGGKCAVCGEANMHFLHIDCINGGKHKKNKSEYIKNPKKYQVLCANHHYEKTYYQIHNKPV